MQLSRQAALLFLRTAFILLCKLLLVDVVCPFVGDWLLNLFPVTRLSPPKFNCTRSTDDHGIQVIICGFPRSGCTTLWYAMDILGFPCLHGRHLVEPSTAKLFMKAYTTGAHQDWECLLHRYKSIVDFPAATSYKNLMEIYPNAKIILNTRDPERWYRSFSKTIPKLRESIVLEVLKPYFSRCVKVTLFQKLLKDQYQNKELSITYYKLHVEEVKRHVPSHRLYILELEKNQGWAPLCDFLQVPIPNVPFPFANERGTMIRRVGIRLKVYGFILIIYIACILGVIVVGLKWIFYM